MEKLLETNEEILNHYGWIIECENPLEIRHGDGSFASKQAARFVIILLREEYDDEVVGLIKENF